MFCCVLSNNKRLNVTGASRQVLVPISNLSLMLFEAIQAYLMLVLAQQISPTVSMKPKYGLGAQSMTIND